MKKVHKMLVLNDGTVTHKKIKGRRTLKFCCELWDGFNQHTNRKYIVIGLLSNDRGKEITYLCKTKDDTQCFTIVYHINISWRRLKKRLIANYTHEHYKRFY